MFLNDNGLVINLSKTSLTESMLHQKRSRTPGEPPSLVVLEPSGEEKLVRSTKYTWILGANLQENLMWQDHMESGIKALLPGARRQLGMLRHQGKSIPMKSRATLARGLVLSRLYYLMPLWGGASRALVNKAQVLVNSAARWATGLGKKTRIATLMKEAGWLSVQEQVKMATLVQTWKLLYLKIPARLLERITVTQGHVNSSPEPQTAILHRQLQMEVS